MIFVEIPVMLESGGRKWINLTNGPCLGKADEDTVVDIAHNPRQAVDDAQTNQCSDFRQGKAHYYIELDSDGEIIRIQ